MRGVVGCGGNGGIDIDGCENGYFRRVSEFSGEIINTAANRIITVPAGRVLWIKT